MRNRSRTKKVTYVLQVTCDKIPEMNEKEFLQEVRDRLYDLKPPSAKFGQTAIVLNGQYPRVSVLRKVEEYLTKENVK